MSTLNCPHCGKIDQVQKISALYTQGTSYTTFSTPAAAAKFDDTTVFVSKENTATSRSALSDQLKPPVAPNIKEPDFDFYFKTGSKKLLNFSIIAFLVGLGGFIAALKDIEPFTPMFFCLGPILSIIVPIYYLFVRSKIIKNGKELYESQMIQYNEKMDKYKYAKNKWESAYYCGRCDVVFTPGSSKFTSVNLMEKFLEDKTN